MDGQATALLARACSRRYGPQPIHLRDPAAHQLPRYGLRLRLLLLLVLLLLRLMLLVLVQRHRGGLCGCCRRRRRHCRRLRRRLGRGVLLQPPLELLGEGPGLLVGGKQAAGGLCRMKGEDGSCGVERLCRPQASGFGTPAHTRLRARAQPRRLPARRHHCWVLAHHHRACAPSPLSPAPHAPLERTQGSSGPCPTPLPHLV